MTHFDAATAAVEAALAAGARYADARVMHRRYESMTARNGEIEELTQDENAGIGVRALVGSSWGFFAVPDLSAAAARRGRPASRDRIAQASAGVPGPAVDLVPATASTGSWASACEIDPLGVPLSDKGDLLAGATADGHEHGRRPRRGALPDLGHPQVVRLLRGAPHRPAHPRVRRRASRPPRSATARPSAGPTRRTAASTAPGAGSWSTSSTCDAHAARIADEARALLTAPLCPPGETTLILGGEQLALQIHESVGHAIELDRILGWEAAYAGTSWLDLARLGSLRYGSELMNITIDPTIPGALGSFGYDDEGTPAGHAGRGTRRDLGRRARRPGLGRRRRPDYAGSVRADGWARLPMVRMTNVGLEPGPHTLDEIIAATDDGVFMDLNRSWSIDDKRLNFQFGCEIGWEVKNGRLRPDAAQPDVHRDRPAVLAFDGHAVPGNGRLGHAQLRQGPTRPGRPHRPPRRAGPLHQCTGGGQRRDDHGGNRAGRGRQRARSGPRVGRPGRRGRGPGRPRRTRR